MAFNYNTYNYIMKNNFIWNFNYNLLFLHRIGLTIFNSLY